MSENVVIQSSEARAVTPALALVLALACGFIAANLYYAQPLTGLIGAALGLGPAQIGLLVTMTQIGYGLGLILFVPLGDLVENRSLAVGGVIVAMAALAVMALAQSASVFLAATLIAGIACSTVQILLPFAAHFTTDADRGRVIGSLTAG
jgi:MFS family permease